MTTFSTSLCICGSSLPRSKCCARYHAGELAPTPELLMRSRYVAYAEQRMDYLRDTWHPDTRPARLDPDPETRWRRLEIISSHEDVDHGMVHFRATWQAAERWGVLEEASRFVREHGRWLYHSGDVIQHSLKPGRNDDCPCGSGTKYKKCCA
jgi:SEC-C motif-containing protein